MPGPQEAKLFDPNVAHLQNVNFGVVARKLVRVDKRNRNHNTYMTVYT